MNNTGPSSCLSLSPQYKMARLSHNNGDQDDPEDHIFDDVYYLKMVHCSQKLLSVNKDKQNGEGCTVGELLFLDDCSSKTLDFAASASMDTLRTSLSQRPSLWSLIGTSKRSSKVNTSNCCETEDWSSLVLSAGRASFSCCPPEINFRIFSLLPQSQILSCRQVCQSWCTQINFFFGFHSVLSSSKLLAFKNKVRKPLPFEIIHYDLVEFTYHHLRHKDFLRLPEPRSVRIIKKISSKNFLKLMDCWRHIESLTIFLEPLTSVALFEKWTYYYPLEYFPELRTLNLHLDRLHLERYKSFSPKQLRFNLDQILMNPYTKLDTFEFTMLNSGRHFACAFLAPILMFIGRHWKSLRNISVVFHTGHELESLPSGGEHQQQHAPCFYIPLEDQLYVHGEVNLSYLCQVNLTHCCLAVPAISGCGTKSGICNYFSTLLTSQKYLRVLQLETLTGVDRATLAAIVHNCQDFLQEIQVTISLGTDQAFDAWIFSKCLHLKALRLKRVGFTDLPNIPSQLVRLETLPSSLIKLSLQRFYVSILELEGVVMDKPDLQCLCVCCCYVNGTKKEEVIADEMLRRILNHSSLKFLCFAPIRRNTLNKVVFKLTSEDSVGELMMANGWYWSVLSRELWLARPRRLILHKGEQWCTKCWFSPYYYEKVKI